MTCYSPSTDTPGNSCIKFDLTSVIELLAVKRVVYFLLETPTVEDSDKVNEWKVSYLIHT